MKIEIINTGSEIMLGRILNTHQQWLCRQLADHGYQVQRQVAIADDAAEIQRAIREAATRSDLIICTGGLGPTSDDLTRQLIAEMLGKPLRTHAGTVTHIISHFERHHRPLPPGVMVQAEIPEGAVVWGNRNGTAPGLLIQLPPHLNADHGRAPWLVMMPGPPRELRPMFTETVMPWLLREYPRSEEFACRTLRSVGIGESRVQALIAPALIQLAASGLEIGYCARNGEVDVRLVGRGSNAVESVNRAAEIVTGLLQPHLYGEGDDTLESVVVRLLSERVKTLALAESCTGGFIAHRITNVPGASQVFKAGLVTYSNSSKRDLLQVPETILAQHGAVSEPAAMAMASGARSRTDADYAVSVTGIAGPSGGTAEKPVGTVYIALADRGQVICRRQLNAFDRETFKFVTSQQALEMLRRRLLGLME